MLTIASGLSLTLIYILVTNFPMHRLHRSILLTIPYNSPLIIHFILILSYIINPSFSFYIIYYINIIIIINKYIYYPSTVKAAYNSH